MTFTLFYVDDSGSETTGYTTFSWVSLEPAHWATATQEWLSFRADTHQRHGLPASARLHATDLASGRALPAAGGGARRNKAGLQVIREGLEVIAALPGVSIGTVYRHTTARGRDFERDKQDLYRRMIDLINRDLHARNSFGAVVMDGDATNTGYARGHRQIPAPRRHLIEDPFFRHASSSQWVQVADLAAWTAYRAVRPNPRRSVVDTWYEDLLRHLDVNGAPVQL